LRFSVAALRRPSRVAALAAALLAAVLLIPDWETGLPDSLRYDVRVRATAVERSAADAPDVAAGAHVVHPESLIEIVAAPDTVYAGLELGLYRREGAEDWRRLRAGAEVEEELFRGGAVFRAPARDLFSQTSGTHRLLLVVAAAGDLPSSFELAPGDDPAPVEAGGRRLVYPLVFELQPAPGSADPGPP
jgi:hypothetical protein